MKCRGELLTAVELNNIANHLTLSYHAKEQLTVRHFGTDLDKIKTAILNSILAYYNTDGSINIARNRWEYFVIVPIKDGFLMITYKEQSHNGIDIYAKRNLAIRGYGRQGF